ncbi:MAG: YceI family protein, partial [Acidimicrobiia bacterium]|nr:YceI family protein [Acidimicrobiia bacterium]
MSLPLAAGEWTMDPVHSNISFAARHLGISTIGGRFIAAEATLAVGDTLESTSLQAEIDLSSVDTGNADRNGHLQSTDFFSVETKPKMRFAS